MYDYLYLLQLLIPLSFRFSCFSVCHPRSPQFRYHYNHSHCCLCTLHYPLCQFHHLVTVIAFVIIIIHFCIAIIILSLIIIIAIVLIIVVFISIVFWLVFDFLFHYSTKPNSSSLPSKKSRLVHPRPHSLPYWLLEYS